MQLTIIRIVKSEVIKFTVSDNLCGGLYQGFKPA